MQLYKFFLLISLSLLFFSFNSPSLVDEFLKKGITIDLRNPLYENGVLSTTDGGVIKGPNIRIQAKNIRCTLQPTPAIEASDQLLVEYCSYAFVGEKICYDFETKTGMIDSGLLSIEPWFFGARRIELFENGSYLFHKAYITTTEDANPEWAIRFEKATLDNNHLIKASQATLRLFDIPVFWFPWVRADLDTLLNSPIKYRFRWGGEQGPRLGMIYEFYSTEVFKAYLRFDYRLNRGPGGGIETDYLSLDKRHFFSTKNYGARDNSIEQPQERTRYRFQGIYGYRSPSYCTSFDLTYDKLSDKEMATDYLEKGLELKTGKKTQANLRHQEKWSITDLTAKVKINDFQTVKQELPTLSTTFYPVHCFNQQLFLENSANVGYLDFQYANFIPNTHNFHSGRAYWSSRAYTSQKIRALTVTPSVRGTGIIYSNSPNEQFEYLGIGSFETEANIKLIKRFSCVKHTIIPYIHYSLYTAPTVNGDNHYIFDIKDGLNSLNLLQVGIKQLIYANTHSFFPSRHLNIDLFTNIFLDNNSHDGAFSKVFANILYDTSPTIRQQVRVAWDFQHEILDHINYRIDWTLSQNFAFSAEYRHRSRFDWRKSNHQNYFLDTFRTTSELLDSPVSDQRDTLLFNTYCRFLPNWAARFYIRHGWNRTTEPNYTEYEIDIITVLRSIWHTKFSYQKREDDHRFAFYFTLSLDRPKPCPY